MAIWIMGNLVELATLDGQSASNQLHKKMVTFVKTMYQTEDMFMSCYAGQSIRDA